MTIIPFFEQLEPRVLHSCGRWSGLSELGPHPDDHPGPGLRRPDQGRDQVDGHDLAPGPEVENHPRVADQRRPQQRGLPVLHQQAHQGCRQTGDMWSIL